MKRKPIIPLGMLSILSLTTAFLIDSTHASILSRDMNQAQNAQSSTSETASKPQIGQLEVVAELDITPGNVTVSRDGRMFASIHGMRRGPAQLIEIKPGRNNWESFPNQEWNEPPGSGPKVLNTAHGVAIDSQDRLWVIDHGNWMPNDAQPQQPKLLAFDINTRELVFRYDFPESTGPRGGIMQDLAVDAERGFVYIADCGSRPAIVVVDVNANTSRRFENHPALNAEDVDLVVEDKRLMFSNADGVMQPASVPVNPITLSADGETLYFGAMSGKTWYFVPANLFREGAGDRKIGQAIAEVGPKPVSDGASTDAEGNHFFTNLEERSIDELTNDGELRQIVQDNRLLWPDNIRFGPDSWLYISVNQLHRTPFFTGKSDAGKPPYYIMRVWTGTQGQPGR
jgi:sugar lactone lactonase YvrE